jgi:hypothetical protein
VAVQALPKIATNKKQTEFKGPVRIVVILLLIGHLIVLIQLHGILKSVKTIAGQPPATMMQLLDGRVLQAQAFDFQYRTPQVIEGFVNQWAMMMFTWGKIPDSSGKGITNDIGHSINLPHGKGTVSKQVPTAAMTAGLMLTDDNGFRINYMAQIAELVSRVSGVLQGTQETQLQISKIISTPQKEPGIWDVQLVSWIRVTDSRGNISQPIENNLKLTVAAIPAPQYPLDTGLSPLQQAIYRMSVSGLMITDIKGV